MQQHQTEVLVVGAGPVGMFTALRLAEKGILTRIIDQEPRTAGHSYACALHPHTLKLLEGVGIAAETIRLGHRINKIAFHGGGVRRVELKMSELPGDYPFALVLDQGRFEDLLEERLSRIANLSVEWKHRLANFDPDDGGVTATIHKMAATGKGYGVPEFDLGVAREFQINAAFVVGADGHGSLVRQQLGLKYESAGEREMFSVFEAETDGGLEDEVKVALDRQTMSVMWPFGEGKCRWSFQLAPAQAHDDFPAKDRSRLIISGGANEENVKQALQRFLRERAPWFDCGIRDVNWHTVIQFEHLLVNSFGRDRCWLAGDAAHQTGPVGMQSMNAGFSEAADLADTLVEILRGGGSPSLLTEYGERHHAEWRQLLGLDGAPKSTPEAGSWASANCGKILECLPASGVEMAALLEQLGLALQPA